MFPWYQSRAPTVTFSNILIRNVAIQFVQWSVFLCLVAPDWRRWKCVPAVAPIFHLFFITCIWKPTMFCIVFSLSLCVPFISWKLSFCGKKKYNDIWITASHKSNSALHTTFYQKIKRKLAHVSHAGFVYSGTKARLLRPPPRREARSVLHEWWQSFWFLFFQTWPSRRCMNHKQLINRHTLSECRWRAVEAPVSYSGEPGVFFCKGYFTTRVSPLGISRDM